MTPSPRYMSRRNEKGEPIYYECGIVMPAAQRNLMVVLVQERVTVQDLVRMFRSILQCLAHMHRQGRLHADVKPLNIVRMESGEWRLVDLDATVRMLVEYIGVKTSTGYEDEGVGRASEGRAFEANPHTPRAPCSSAAQPIHPTPSSPPTPRPTLSHRVRDHGSAAGLTSSASPDAPLTHGRPRSQVLAA